jgi:glycosyltransferase involved in cell wall biosynthesis
MATANKQKSKRTLLMTSHIPLISVIMPAYNHVAYIGEAIESVLGQTYSDFEFIIINDGSKDDTERVIRSFTDFRIRYYSQKNSGAHKALNLGISLAEGKYISIINSDDIYFPERLTKLFHYAESESLDFIFTAIEHIDSKSMPISLDDGRRAGYEKLLKSYKETGDLLGITLVENIALTSSNFFFTKLLLGRVGYFSSYRYAHDYDFLLRVFKACGPTGIAILPERLLKYRLHGNNTITEDACLVSLEANKILMNHLAEFIYCDEDRKRFEPVLRNLLLKANEDISRLMRTRSWKLTAPLRWLAEAINLPPRSGQ